MYCKMYKPLNKYATQFLIYASPELRKLKSTIKKGDRSASCRSLPGKVLKLSVKESWVKAEVISPLDGNQQVWKCSVRDIKLSFFWEHSLSCKSSLYPVLENKTVKKKIHIFYNFEPRRSPGLNVVPGNPATSLVVKLAQTHLNTHRVRTEFSNPKQTASLRQIARF